MEAEDEKGKNEQVFWMQASGVQGSNGNYSRRCGEEFAW